MNLKRNSLGIFLALISTVAFAAAGDRYIENQTSNKDIIFQVNKAGVKTEVMRANGTTGTVSVSLDPTVMSNADATRVGLKSYSHGTTYNGGIAPTVSISGPSSVVISFGRCIPYQLQDGSWRVKLSLKASFTSYGGGIFISIVGLATNSDGAAMPVMVAAGGSPNPNYSLVNDSVSTGQITISPNVAIGTIFLNGEFGLSSKPTWAY